jgi:hypothetical protein
VDRGFEAFGAGIALLAALGLAIGEASHGVALRSGGIEAAEIVRAAHAAAGAFHRKGIDRRELAAALAGRRTAGAAFHRPRDAELRPPARCAAAWPAASSECAHFLANLT